MKRSSLFLLILCNIAWAMNPLMGKVLLRSYDGLQVAWIRYFGAFMAYFSVAVASLLFQRGKRWRDYFLAPSDWRTGFELLALGIGPFVFSPILQFVGLETAQAMDNSILIATEPLITVLLAWVVLGERMTRDHWISMGIALVGFLLFSGAVSFSVSKGMVLLLFALLGEATFSVFSRKLAQVYPPSAVLGTALAIGALVLTAVVAMFGRLPTLGFASIREVGAALCLGPIGSTLTYLIWSLITRTVSVPSMVITLFIQPIVGALLGFLLLGESLTPGRFAGALLILAGIGFLFFWELRRTTTL